MKAWKARGSDYQVINDKNIKRYTALDLGCWVITSNGAIPLPLEHGDRREYVIETPNEFRSDAYYDEHSRWQRHEGGNNAVIAYLCERWDSMALDRRKILFGRAPDSQAKQELIKGSGTGIESAIRLAIAGEEGIKWPNLMTSSDVFAELTNDAEFKLLTASERKNQLKLPRMGVFLKAAGAVRLFNGTPVQGSDRKPMRLWCLRPRIARMYEELGQGQAIADRYRKEYAEHKARRFTVVAEENKS
jgi:hypothetical protein